MSATLHNTPAQPSLVSELWSYSTGDVERSVFYGETRGVDHSEVPTGPTTLLVVNGEFFELSEETSPIPWTVLTPDSGLARLSEPSRS
jgi:hypothetical protein